MPRVGPQPLQHVVPDGGDGRAHGRLLGLDEAHQRLGLQKPVRHDQVGPGHQGGVRRAPGVGVEHRHDGQRPVPEGQLPDVGSADRQRVQVHRAVAVGDPLGLARGAARVADRGGRPLVDHRPGEDRGRRGECLGVGQDRLAGRLERCEVSLAGDQHVRDRRHQCERRRQHRQQAGVGENHPVVGVGGDEAELLRRQPDVQRVQDSAHGRHGEVGLEVLLVVPHERRDPLVAGDPQCPQRIRRPAGPLGDLAVACPPARAAGAGAGDHHAVGERRGGGPHHRGDGERDVLHGALHGRPPG